MGAEFVQSFLVRDVTDLFHFVRKIVPVTDKLREEFISNTIGLLEDALEAFLEDLAQSCGYVLKSHIFENGEPSSQLKLELNKLSDHLARKANKYKNEIKIVQQLHWFFDNYSANANKRFLLTSPEGPGLAVFIWNVGKGNNLKWFRAVLEFDCEGQIFATRTRVAEKQTRVNCVISCGEIKVTLSDKSKKKAKSQLSLRLNVIKAVLERCQHFDGFTLRGFCFYLKNGHDPILELQKLKLQQHEETSAQLAGLEITFVPLRTVGQDSFDDDEEEELSAESADGSGSRTEV